MTEEKYEVITRHRNECESARKLFDEAVAFREIDVKKATKMMKRVKAVVEAMSARHDAERLACGLDNPVDLVQLVKKEKARRILLGEWNSEAHEG